VGIRGSRIKNIVEELGGEKIDIVRWNDSSKILIGNSLRPAEVAETALCFELGRATVVVAEDQLSLAIGKRGQNVRLAARLTGWDIDILTPSEFNNGLDILEKSIREIEGVDSTVVDQIVAMGMVSVLDVEEVGAEPLINELNMDRELAQRIVVRCAEEAKRVADQQAAERAKAEEAAARGEAAPAPGDAVAEEAVEQAEAAGPAEAAPPTEAPAAVQPAGEDETEGQAVASPQETPGEQPAAESQADQAPAAEATPPEQQETLEPPPAPEAEEKAEAKAPDTQPPAQDAGRDTASEETGAKEPQPPDAPHRSGDAS
jgi:N utilization substance protein A